MVLFPVDQRAEDLMMGTPSEVLPKQLRELHIRVVIGLETSLQRYAAADVASLSVGGG